MEHRRTRYFLAVADQGSFRAAAEVLNVAQSALSRHVAELEAGLGVALFERHPGGARLTGAGRVYAEEARRAMELMVRAGSRARRAARGELAHLAIGMNDIGARHPGLARAVAGFSARFPEVHLEFAAMVSRDQVAALEAGRIDAAVLVDRPRRAGLAHLALGRDPFVLALPAGHPLAALDPVPVAALAAERFVSVAMAAYRAHQTRLWLRCGELGLAPEVAVEAANDHLQIGLIEAGMGVGFVNASAARRLRAEVAYRPVEGLDVGLDLDLLWRTDRCPPALRNFVGEVRRHAGPGAAER